MEKSKIIDVKIIFIVALFLFIFTYKADPIMETIKFLLVKNLLLILLIIIIAVYALRNEKWQKE